MGRISEYRFGHIVIDDREFVRDVIVLPSRVVPDRWRAEGHSLCLEDLAGVLDDLHAKLIVGTGHDSQMRPRTEVLDDLASAGWMSECYRPARPCVDTTS